MRAASFWAAGANFFGTAALSVLVLLADQQLGLDSAGFGALLAAGAVGGILAGNMVAATAYALLALTSSVALAAIALALASFASMCGNVVAVSLRQTSVPSELLGRVPARTG